jgi:predicted unusual protein kinase regulating ubiquinone biosynthesis (AarF/ABC1/UbiB family)
LSPSSEKLGSKFAFQLQLYRYNPPVPFRSIRRTVERSLGAKLSEHFSEFDPVPIATASIAQVHNATLKSNGGAVQVEFS